MRLAAAWVSSPGAPTAASLANAVLGSLTALVMAALSARIMRRRGMAIVTGAAAALSPALAWGASGDGSGPLFLALLLSAGYLLLAATDRPSSNLAVAAGGFLALAAACGSAVLCLTLAPLLLAPALDRRYPLRVGIHIALSGLLGFGATLVPLALGRVLSSRVPAPAPEHTGVVGAYLAALSLLATIGFLRGERRGVRTFALALLAITVFVLVGLELPWSSWVALSEPVILIYGVFGASTLVAWRHRTAPSAA